MYILGVQGGSGRLVRPSLEWVRSESTDPVWCVRSIFTIYTQTVGPWMNKTHRSIWCVKGGSRGTRDSETCLLAVLFVNGQMWRHNSERMGSIGSNFHAGSGNLTESGRRVRIRDRRGRPVRMFPGVLSWVHMGKDGSTPRVYACICRYISWYIICVYVLWKGV